MSCKFIHRSLLESEILPEVIDLFASNPSLVIDLGFNPKVKEELNIAQKYYSAFLNVGAINEEDVINSFKEFVNLNTFESKLEATEVYLSQHLSTFDEVQNQFFDNFKIVTEFLNDKEVALELLPQAVNFIKSFMEGKITENSIEIAEQELDFSDVTRAKAEVNKLLGPLFSHTNIVVNNEINTDDIELENKDVLKVYAHKQRLSHILGEAIDQVSFSLDYLQETNELLRGLDQTDTDVLEFKSKQNILLKKIEQNFKASSTNYQAEVLKQLGNASVLTPKTFNIKTASINDLILIHNHATHNKQYSLQQRSKEEIEARLTIPNYTTIVDNPAVQRLTMLSDTGIQFNKFEGFISLNNIARSQYKATKQNPYPNVDNTVSELSVSAFINGFNKSNLGLQKRILNTLNDQINLSEEDIIDLSKASGLSINNIKDMVISHLQKLQCL